MDATTESFAYRCLPLNIANSHGWEILNPYRFSAGWDGGTSKESVTLIAENPAHLPALSHFGSGVLTAMISYAAKAEPIFCGKPEPWFFDHRDRAREEEPATPPAPPIRALCEPRPCSSRQKAIPFPSFPA